MEVNNGAATSFWYDHWSSMGRLKDLLGERGFVDMGIPENLTIAEAIQSHRRRNHRVVILNRVKEEIEKVKSKSLQMEDMALWKSNAESYKTSFSSNNTWQLIRKEYVKQGWSKGVWFKYDTPKYSFHVWTAMQDRLSTCDRILKWNPAIDPTCVLCEQEMETRNHLFYSCSYSREVWQKLTKGLLLGRYTEKWEEIGTLLLDESQDRVKLYLLRYTFQAAAHSIWRERNCRRHGEKHLPHTLLVKVIDKNVRNRLSTIKRQGGYKLEGGLRMWFGSR